MEHLEKLNNCSFCVFTAISRYENLLEDVRMSVFSPLIPVGVFSFLFFNVRLATNLIKVGP